VPRPRDLAIFVLTTTQPIILPLVCVLGVKINVSNTVYLLKFGMEILLLLELCRIFGG
jgi:hypothetical protein